MNDPLDELRADIAEAEGRWLRAQRHGWYGGIVFLTTIAAILIVALTVEYIDILDDWFSPTMIALGVANIASMAWFNHWAARANEGRRRLQALRERLHRAERGQKDQSQQKS